MIKNKLKLGYLVLAAFIGITSVTAVSAADLTFTADYTVHLNAQNVDLIILSGSEADSLTVKENRVEVIVGDGDVFTIKSDDRELTASGETTSSADITCVSGVSTVEITGGADGETITISPRATACTASGGGGGGGSSGGSSSSQTPGSTSTTPTTTTTTTTTTPVYCNAGETFNGSTGERCTAVTPATSTSSTSTTSSTTSTSTVTFPVYVWNRDLTVGSIGEDVRQLQIYLNTHGFVVATFGAGAPGFETSYFGLKTKAAVGRWQLTVGLNGMGYFGSLSRAILNARVAVSYPAGCTSSAGFSATTGRSCSATYPSGCTSYTGFSATTGASCSATYPAGCTSNTGFSATTGQSCAATTTSTTTTTTTP